MKSATIREVQHNLAGVLRLVEAGHTVEIRRRKVPVAQISPPQNHPGTPAALDWSDHQRRMAETWRSTMVRDGDETLEDLRGGR